MISHPQSKQVAAAPQAIAGVKKAVATAVASKKKNNKRKTSGRQSGGQTTQPVQEQVAGALQDDTIDPDEETYCLCGQISYGEMILCENDLCPIEWFHFSCVSLQSKPKGRWWVQDFRIISLITNLTVLFLGTAPTVEVIDQTSWTKTCVKSIKTHQIPTANSSKITTYLTFVFKKKIFLTFIKKVECKE